MITPDDNDSEDGDGADYRGGDGGESDGIGEADCCDDEEEAMVEAWGRGGVCDGVSCYIEASRDGIGVVVVGRRGETKAVASRMGVIIGDVIATVGKRGIIG